MTSQSFLTIATFYQFISLNDLSNLREKIFQFGQTSDLRGTILLASEGINATIGGNTLEIEKFRRFLVSELNFNHLSWKQTTANLSPFRRWKVKIKREIVTLGAEDAYPEIATGKFISPDQWNTLMDDPDVIMIDTRNDYEVAVGTFPGAKNPQTQRFSQFVEYAEQELEQYKKRKIAMFCTGGIRCEKASSFLLNRGFEEIYQLDGGILNYLEKVPVEQSRWQGECVVFDERVAVDHAQHSGHHQWCARCGTPVRIQVGSFCDVCIDRNGCLSPEQKTPLNTAL